jgi:hypothetical protein
VYPAELQDFAVSLSASDALLRAGLERACAMTGVRVAAPGQRATLSIRSERSGIAHPSLDVVVAQDRTIVTVHGQPDRAVWLALHDVLAQLVSAMPGPEGGARRVA